MNKLTVVLCLLFISVSTVLVLAQIVFPTQFSIVPQIEKHNVTFPMDNANTISNRGIGGRKLPVRPTAVTINATSDNYQKCNFKIGRVHYNGNCSRLLTKCDDDAKKWLIIDQLGSTVCAFRSCSLGKLPFEGRCVSVADDSICGAFEILYVEFTGEVHCDCMLDYVYDKGLGRCVEEHRQGSCPDGEILELQERQIACVKNNCSTDDLIYNSEDGQCYVKTFLGTCSKSKGLYIKFDNLTLNSSCIFPQNRNFYEVPALSSCPVGTKRNSLNQCLPTFRVNTEVMPLKVPATEVVATSGCPKPFIRRPNGICTRPNPMLAAQY